MLYDEKFYEDNIIATCQFSNILADKEKWIEDNNKKPESEQQEEWENPYFGFPKMLRFAFNIPESSQSKLIALKKDGKWSLNDLLETNQDDSNTKFVHEEDVLQLLKAIDGASEEKGILGFLDIPKIKDNNVCKHIVMVLPYKYSCDAMEILLNNHKHEFKNLINDNVEVLNITGHKVKPSLVEIDDVKRKISDCEKEGKKTITLTVNKMLTGVTVPEWDTMIMLKNSKSPQEYDQAIFRIQNQYVTEYVEEKSGETIKKDMKPQTILVDFDPMRMFELLGLSTRIVNKIKKDELTLEEALKEETKFFNIIAYNADKLVEVHPNNLVEIITNYNNKKSLMEGVAKVKLNPNLLKDKYLEEFIKNQSEVDISNKLTAEAHKGTKKDIDTPEDNEDEEGNSTGTGEDTSSDTKSESNKEMEKRYRMCILGLSFYAFLSDSNICCLKDVLKSIEEESAEKVRNNRIFDNLKLDKEFIKKHIELDSRLNSFEIEGFIKRANMLSKDESLSPENRAKNALNNFSRISDSEIVTPKEICDKMIECLGGEHLERLIDIVNNGGRILDIASKTGEFAYSLYSLLKDKVDTAKLRNAMYAIPTSSVTYDFTRKMFENLELQIENIANPTNVTSYSLLENKKKDKKGNETNEIDYDKICEVICNEFKKEGETEMIKFDAVVGNPPYQEDDGGAQKSAKPIYNAFVKAGKKLQPEYLSIIMPTRWYAGGKGLDEFRDEMLRDKHIRELHDFLHPEEVFPDTNNRGGICYFARTKSFDNTQVGVTIVTHEGEGKTHISQRSLKTRDLDIFIRDSRAISILDKVLPQEQSSDTFDNHISAAKAFGFRTFFINDSKFRTKPVGLKNPVKCYGRSGKEGYVDYSEIATHKEWVKLWKVYVPESNNIGTELNDDNQNAFVGVPNTVCTETFLVVGADLNLDENKATNLCNYLKTKFARYLLSLAKISQHGTAKTYRFVPVQDFSKAWTDKDLYKKYGLSIDEQSFIESAIKDM